MFIPLRRARRFAADLTIVHLGRPVPPHPEIDSARIGVSGSSGGFMTNWLTAIGDGDQRFTLLKKVGVPVMVRYPRSSHGLSRAGERWLLVDRIERIRSWFVHFLIENPPQDRAATQGGR